MVLFYESLAVFQDVRFVFHHGVGRQSALAFTDAHAAAHGGESHTDFLQSPDLVIDGAVIGKDVEMIAGCGAAA